MYIICSVFLYRILGPGEEVKFVFGVEFNNFFVITEEMVLFTSLFVICYLREFCYLRC